MDLSYRWRDFWGAEHDTFEEGGLKLPFQLAFAPSLADGKAQTEFTLFRTFALSQNDDPLRSQFPSRFS
ncbi:hypothetical protein HDF11_004768 [Tunturiibacter psychrotolerans]